VKKFGALSTKILNCDSLRRCKRCRRRQDPIARTIITTAETAAVNVAKHP
jgi:hypothetical protein